MKKKRVLGIDIGSKTTKVVEGTFANGQIVVDNYGIYNLPMVQFNSDKITNARKWAKELKKQLRKSKIKSKQAYIVFSNSNAFVRKIEMPQMDTGQLSNNLRFQLREFLPNNIDQYVIDYKVLKQQSEADVTKQQIYVVAILNSIIEEYIHLLKLAGIKVLGVDVESNARGTLINSIHGTEGVSGIIDIGYQFTDVSIFKNGDYYINRVIDWGLQNYFSNKGKAQAQEIIDEITRVFTFFRNQNNMSNIDYLYIVGGGVLERDIREPIISNLLPMLSNGDIQMGNVQIQANLKNPLEVFILFNALSLLTKEKK